MFPRVALAVPARLAFVMSNAPLTSELKELIVRELHLEGRDPSSIGDEALLFGDPREAPGSLGLDSLDALQLATSIEERFGVRIPEGEEARPVFRSVSSLAEFITRVGREKSAAGEKAGP